MAPAPPGLALVLLALLDRPPEGRGLTLPCALHFSEPLLGGGKPLEGLSEERAELLAAAATGLYDVVGRRHV